MKNVIVSKEFVRRFKESFIGNFSAECEMEKEYAKMMSEKERTISFQRFANIFPCVSHYGRRLLNSNVKELRGKELNCLEVGKIFWTFNK